MGKFDIPEKPKVILKGLRKLKLEVISASNHDVATCPATNKKTTIPRHNPLNKFTVGSICEFLLTNGYTEKQIKDAFKWR